MENKLENSLKIGLLFAIFLFGFSISQVWNEHTEAVESTDLIGNLPYMCYTDLQPSPFLSDQEPRPYKYNYKLEDFTIDLSDETFRVSRAAPTGSMRPGIPDGAILLLVEPKKSEVKVGDIISLKREDKNNLLHRVINITTINNQTIYITKGDNNKLRDASNWTFSDINDKLIGVFW